MLVLNVLNALALVLFPTSVVSLLCSQGAHDQQIHEAIEVLLGEGYTVEEGTLVFTDATEFANIPFPDPNEMFGVFNFSHQDRNLPGIRLGGSDAILFHGCTPPESTYFGFRSYFVGRAVSNGNNIVLESDMGDTINNLKIKTSDQAFNSFTTIVSTGDELTYYDIRTAFALTRLRSIINLDVIPSDYYAFDWNGVNKKYPYDLFTVILHSIYLKDANTVDYNTYINTPQKVYYIRSTRTVSGQLQPRIPLSLTLRGTRDGKSEQTDIGDCLDDLIISIADMMDPHGWTLSDMFDLVAHPGGPHDQIIEEDIFNWGLYCIEYETNCSYSNRDTLYSWHPGASYLDDDHFYMVVGVDHNKMDKTIYNTIATYLEFSANATSDYLLIQSLSNFEYDQANFTAVIPHGNSTCMAERANLFVIQVARPDQCIDGISGMCLGVDELGSNDPFVFFSRAHLNPSTFTHPDPAEVMLPVVLTFTRPTE